MNQMFETTRLPIRRIVEGSHAPAAPVHSAPMARLPEIEDRTAGLRDLFAILFRRKAWIIATALAFTLAAAFYAFTRPRDYVATARVLIDPRGIQIVDRDLTPPAQTSDATVAIVENQLRIMTSEVVLSRVIEQEDLVNDPEFTDGSSNPLSLVRSLVSGMFGGSGAQADPHALVLQALSDAIAAGRPERSFIVELSVRTRDGAKSARIANAIVNTYLSSEVSERAGLARRASTSLAGRLDELESTLRASEDEAERYKEQHGIVDSEGKLVNEQQLTQLNASLGAARARTSEALARLEQIQRLDAEGANPDTLPEAVLSGTVRQLRAQYAATRQREVAQSARLLPGHPTMVQIAAEVSSLREEIANELSRISIAAEAEYERARANEHALAVELEAQKKTAYSTNDAMIRLRELERQVEANRIVYESFLVRARELGEQESVDSAIARVIAEAIAPLAPRGPGNALILAIAGVVGLGLGTLLAIGRDALDPTIRSARQIEDAVGLRVLATVPVSIGDCEDGLPAFVARYPAAPSSGALYNAVDQLKQMPCIGLPRTIVVTACGNEDGKTTVALNLALAAGVRGDRVLLVDGDLARRTLSTVRYGEPRAGLTGLINGDIKLSDALVTDRSGLIQALPAGLKSSHRLAARLNGEDVLSALYHNLDAFDLVVVDGGSATADGGVGVFAGIADAIVLVARADVTSEHRLAAAIRVIGPAWTRVSGAILVADRS